jgi:hypothetical protein
MQGYRSPRLFTPVEMKALAKSKVHQWSRAWLTVFRWVVITELYYITGGGAPISLQSTKCRQKHGGFSHLLTPEWRHWSQILVVITTEQGSFWAHYHFHIPLIFAKIFQLFVLKFASVFAFSLTF